MTSKMNIARLAPEFDFPPYTYVPGQTPHPVSDPAGHMYGETPQPAQLFVDDWPRCRAYLRGIDLFNHGYYWEAHEVWESLWHAAGRKGPVADFLKGLIKLAAAGVKTLEGSPTGRARHSRRAAELFRSSADALTQDHVEQFQRMMGLPLDRLILWSEQSSVSKWTRNSPEGHVELVFAFVLSPSSDTEFIRKARNGRDD